MGFSVSQMHAEMKVKSPGAVYNRVRLINGIYGMLEQILLTCKNREYGIPHNIYIFLILFIYTDSYSSNM